MPIAMSKTNKWIFYVGLIIFALPVYLLSFSFGLLSLGAAVVGNTIGNRVVEVITLVFIFVSLWVFAKLSFDLLFKIDSSSTLYNPWYWRCIYTILVYTAVGVLISIWLQSMHWTIGQEPSGIESHLYSVLYSGFKWALFGIPMLVPGFHLIAMKRKLLPEIEANSGRS